jgi:hypothetical protein
MRPKKKAGRLIRQAAGRSFGRDRIRASQNALRPSGARDRTSASGSDASEIPCTGTPRPPPNPWLEYRGTILVPGGHCRMLKPGSCAASRAQYEREGQQLSGRWRCQKGSERNREGDCCEYIRGALNQPRPDTEARQFRPGLHVSGFARRWAVFGTAPAGLLVVGPAYRSWFSAIGLTNQLTKGQGIEFRRPVNTKNLKLFCYGGSRCAITASGLSLILSALPCPPS